MNIITIPKELVKERELVLVPRRIWEKLVRASKKKIEEVKMTSLQKKALERGRRNKKRGNFLTFNELTSKLDITD